MIDAFIAGLRANTCTVEGPMQADDARDAILRRANGLVACNDDVPISGIAEALGALTPDDPAWAAQLSRVEVGVTGARLAIAEPSAIALASGPGAPRATSLVPPAHVCVLRVTDVVASLDAAFDRITTSELPSALTWISGPSRTGDLEMVLTLGVHGPRTVDVILLES
jgi:L-lactate dehydrogenase complex protein LldG